jgi:hypothetical protein
MDVLPAARDLTSAIATMRANGASGGVRVTHGLVELLSIVECSRSKKLPILIGQSMLLTVFAGSRPTGLVGRTRS